MKVYVVLLEDTTDVEGTNSEILSVHCKHEKAEKVLAYSVVKYDNSEFHDIKVYASEYVKFKRLKKYEDAV